MPEDNEEIELPGQGILEFCPLCGYPNPEGVMVVEEFRICNNCCSVWTIEREDGGTPEDSL